MSELNDDSKFKAFTDEISSDYQRVLKDSIAREVFKERAQAALEAAHYEPLVEGSERYIRQWDEIEARLRERYATEAFDEDFESYVAHECAAQLYAMSVSEDAYIATIEMLDFAAHQADEIRRDPAAIRQIKMSIMADMVIGSQILTDSPLMKFANDFAPGGLVDFHAPEMQPYIVRSLEKVEHARTDSRRSNEIVKIAYKIARIEFRRAEDAERIENAIQDMLLASDYKDGSTRDSANRQARLYEIAREANIDPDTTEKLVAYFEETFPPSNN